jgi:hypothetical protein
MREANLLKFRWRLTEPGLLVADFRGINSEMPGRIQIDS